MAANGDRFGTPNDDPQQMMQEKLLDQQPEVFQVPSWIPPSSYNSSTMQSGATDENSLAIFRQGTSGPDN